MVAAPAVAPAKETTQTKSEDALVTNEVSPFPTVADAAIRSAVRYSRAPSDQVELFINAEDTSSNIEWLDTPVDFHDARALMGNTSVDREGFETFVTDSKVASWDDEKEVTSVFYAEAVELVKKITGAKHASVFDHTFRRVDNSKAGRPAGRDPVNGVHVDYSSASANKRLRDFFGNKVAENSGRFAIVNVWRPVMDVVLDKPLGFIDATTVQKEDFSVYKLILKDRVGENQTVHPNMAHKWYYIPQQRGNEVYVFKQFDSDTTKTQWTPHTGFDDPTAPADDSFQKRESIELRIFLFYDKDESEIEALKSSN